MVLGVKIILKTSLALPGTLAHRLQCRTVCNNALSETPLRLRPKLKKYSPCLKHRHGSYLRHDPPHVLIKTRLRHGNRVLVMSNIFATKAPIFMKLET